MARMPRIRIDGTKVKEELRRWLKGDLEHISEGYLEELVEIEGIDPNKIKIEIPLTCPFCDEPTRVQPCPECALVERDDCQYCLGMGGWLECNNLKCPGPDEGQDFVEY